MMLEELLWMFKHYTQASDVFLNFSRESSFLLKKWHRGELMNCLIDNLDKLHTTELGALRIRKNLDLSTSEVVEWCKEAIIQASLIMKLDKNYYVYYNGSAITINARYTIITAHKINPKVRVMQESDYVCLNEFLYQAIFIPEGVELPARSIINDPEISIYIEGFGSKAGDLGVVAEQNCQIIGAAWTRIIPAYGYVDSTTPELAISMFPEFRGYGVGTRLMNKLFQLLKENGYNQISLSVQKGNPAVRFYQRLGYEIINKKLDHAGNGDYLMMRKL